MKLTYDILIAVMDTQLSDGVAHDLSSMSRVCRPLRHEGAKHLLDHGVALRNDREIISFEHFMRADADRRFSLLRHSLSIQAGSESLSQQAAYALLEIVRGLSHLDRLALLNADTILASHPQLPQAFASVSCLTHLQFSVSEKADSLDCVYMFNNMQSRLETASLHLPSPIPRWSNGETNCELIDPIHLLRNSASTLTELSVSNFEARRHDFVYPQMRRLRVHLGLMPLISPYIVSFPNLLSLDVVSDTTFDWSCLPVFVYMNEDSQEQFGCWTALEELSGKLLDLYAFALRCRVKILRIDASTNKRSTRYLTELLSRARPSHLELTMTSTAYRVAGEHGLASILGRSGAAQFIESLDLRIMMKYDDSDAGSEQLFMRLMETAGSLALSSFHVLFEHDFGVTSGTSTLYPDPESVALYSRGKGFLFVLTSQHAERLQKASPSLKRLTIEESRGGGAPRELFAMCFGDGQG